MVKTSASLTLRLTRKEETSELYWGFQHWMITDYKHIGVYNPFKHMVLLWLNQYQLDNEVKREEETDELYTGGIFVIRTSASLSFEANARGEER